ncbi:MAG: enoyl-CoA hydratase [Rhodovarius sp.]|nr:enoyl-CoA hydratase [Rhodovarius sp.]
MEPELLHEVRAGIAFVTFNRPQARNALTFAMYEGLAEICRAASEDPGVRAVVITGAGGQAFAAGTDIGQFVHFRTAEDALAYEAKIDRILTAVEDCTKPTIAAIAGACTGGGAAIAAACDLRIGAANARFGFPIAKTLGNTLSMANHARLVALLGPARVADLIFTARLMGAEEMRAAGLLSEVLPDYATLQARAAELAQTVASHAPLTLRATKIALKRLTAAARAIPGDDLVEMCFTSRDFAEGVQSFLARRPPRWEGR